MICRTYPLGTLAAYQYVVILSRYRGRILLSRHRLRSTWETQGGHIEPGETPMQAARRELFEESGAADYDIAPLCDYWAGTREGVDGANGVVFAAKIRALGPMPESEMAEVREFDALPENVTYPAITPVLFARLAAQRRAGEIVAGKLRVLIGTTNPAKVGYFESLLAGAPVEFVTLDDLGVTDEPEETGASPAENACIKARFYGRYADAVICADSGLYLEALALEDPRQPGLHARSPQGVRLDDEDMIAYYAALSRSLGGHQLAYYLDGCAVGVRGDVAAFQATREEALEAAFYLEDTPCAARKPGWPLDSLAVDLQGMRFLDPARTCAPQQVRAYQKRLRAFLLEKLGLEA